VFEIVLYRMRYKLSLRNLAEMFLLRGFQFTHRAVRDWEARLAPAVVPKMLTAKKRRRGIGVSITFVLCNGTDGK